MEIVKIRTGNGQIVSGIIVPNPTTLEEDIEITMAEARGCSYPASDKAAVKALMDRFIITPRPSETGS